MYRDSLNKYKIKVRNYFQSHTACAVSFPNSLNRNLNLSTVLLFLTEACRLPCKRLPLSVKLIPKCEDVAGGKDNLFHF